MNITMTKTDEVLIVKIGYEHLDASNIEKFKTEINLLLNGTGAMVFDLSAIQFIDSSGLGALLSCQRRVNAGGGELVLCAMQSTVRTIFEMVRMSKIIKIFDTQEKAIQALQTP